MSFYHRGTMKKKSWWRSLAAGRRQRQQMLIIRAEWSRGGIELNHSIWIGRCWSSGCSCEPARDLNLIQAAIGSKWRVTSRGVTCVLFGWSKTKAMSQHDKDYVPTIHSVNSPPIYHLVSLEGALRIYTGSGSYTDSAMSHCYVSTVAQSGQT